MSRKSKGSSLPPASLHLLVPPVRLMSAFVLQTMQQRQVEHYDKLLDFIGLVTEIVPELLSVNQRAQLVLGLRARLVLELCRGDIVANMQSIQSHLDKVHACSAELSSDGQTSGDILNTSYTNFASLVEKLLNVPFERDFFFQEVFLENYGSAFDEKLQQMVSDFLSRLELLLPIPDLPQTAAWLTETASVSEDFEQHLSYPFDLKTLLLHHRQLGTISSAPTSSEEDILTLALPSQTVVARYTEAYNEEGDDDDYDSEEETLALEDLEAGDSSPSSDVTAENWLPKKESGPLSRLFICPECSFVDRVKRKVQEHIQSEHQITAPIIKKEPVKKASAKAQQKGKDLNTEKKISEGNTNKKRKRKQKDGAEKKQERKQKKDNLENKERRRQKGTTGEDKRFLSTRPVNKIVTEAKTKCLTCDKVFQHPNQLKTHMKLHGLRYHCSQCEKGFTSPSGYYQHQRLHKRGRIFSCSQCNKGFLCKNSLKQHERLHEGPSNLCTICGKSFSKAGITRHMQMHRGEKNYLCTTCGKSFLSSGELLLHTRSHTGELPYTCSRCGKGFSSKSHLIVHTRSHTGERPYQCSECPKRFLTLNCLKRHTLSHNGVKPFKCPSCEREFSQQGNLKRHLATHKPDT